MSAILVCGPPCSGKTTYTERHARPGDTVLDFDAIARDLGSPVGWLHPEPFRSQAEAEFRTRLTRISRTGTTYVIRSAASPSARVVAARSIGATQCVVLLPSQAECHERADADDRPDGTHEQIGRWFAAYARWSGDTTVGSDSAALDIFGR